jgi:PKD repeat protein
MAVFVMVLIIIGATMAKVVNVTSAPSPTTIFADPTEVSNALPGNTFLIRINISEAPPTYAWQFRLGWDRTLLNVSSVEEGDFLHRWQVNPFPPPDYLPLYQTSLVKTPLDEANAKGEILVTCTLQASLPTGQWANGSGWLSSLNFTVKSTGSTLLDLFNTRLLDHLEGGHPASSPYPNNDSFFYNMPPPTHDVRISKVTPLPVNVIRGSAVNMNVTVLNEGTETEPSVTLNVKANETLIGTTILVLNGTGNSENRSSTYSLDWNTAGLAFGEYNITASVPAVPSEVDTADNALLVGTVRVMLHDIAVTNVVTNATTVKIGEIVAVNVTIVNDGSDAEAFDVYAYYNDFLIQYESFSSFAPGNQTTITFTWNTIFVSADVYTIKANATSATDTNTANNEFKNGNVTVYRETGWPIANFTYSPLRPLVNQTITFTSTSYDEDGYITSWAWDFNDDGIIDATTEVATWNYTVSGNHRVTLTVNDNDTLTPPIGTAKTIRVYPRPLASFTYSPQNPLINEAVTFDASASSDPDGTIVDYSWDFGDYQTGIGQTVSHTYTSFGTYTVTLNVTDNDGFKGTKSSEVRVTKVPIASFTFSPSSPLVFQTITFNASSSTPNGGSITRYFWDFGDDNIANETDPITTHSYSPADTYTVTLTITDSEGLTSTATQSIVVGKLSSTTSMNVTPSSITRGEKVTITGSISPERQGVTVMILYRLSGAETWSVLNTVTTSNNGQYSYDWTPTAAGTYEVKAMWEGDANTVGDESDTKIITVQETSIIPDSTLLLIAGIIIVIAVAVAVYFLKFRKQKTQRGPPANPS